MAFYQIKDNSKTKIHKDDISEYDLKCDLDNFKRYSDISIKCLRENNPGLIIFPSSNYTEDKIEESNLFSLTYSESEPEIVSGNIMGFIGTGNTQLSITSRFANQEEDYFLHYMLQKVLHLNIVDFSANSSNDRIFNLIVYLFPKFLEKAVRQGIYKEYKTNHYNDSNVRGVIEVSRHIKNNIPFNGKAAYKTREYSYDNNVTQLIRHTIEYLKSMKDMYKILSADSDILEAVEKIISVTPSYNVNNRCKVIINNMKSINHSYFTEYLPLQKLCLMILQHKMQKFGSNKNEVYGVLFDGAWLWEEYLATLLKPEFKHPENKKGKGRLYVFQDKKETYCYPDFYKKDNDNDSKTVVLDAKYKHLDWGNPPREDLYQVISYMYILKAVHGGFLYPCDKENTDEMEKLIGELKGYGGVIKTYGLNIPQNVSSYNEFCKIIKQNEDIFCSTIFNNL